MSEGVVAEPKARSPDSTCGAGSALPSTHGTQNRQDSTRARREGLSFRELPSL